MTIFKLHSEPLQDAWLDAYGHLNEAYYLVPLSNATWKVQDEFNIGVDYFAETGCALYTVETHIRYVSDVRRPAQLDIESMILGSDAKKIWLAHQMRVDEIIRATAEFMILHFDTRAGRTTAMPESVQVALKNAEPQALPDWVAGQIGFRK